MVFYPHTVGNSSPDIWSLTYVANLSNTDRLLRVVVGVVLVAVALMYSDNAWAGFGWVGVVPLATGLIGWCGLYALVGYTTREARHDT